MEILGAPGCRERSSTDSQQYDGGDEPDGEFVPGGEPARNGTDDRSVRGASSHRIEQGDDSGRLFTRVIGGGDGLSGVRVEYSVPNGLSVERILSVDRGQWSLGGPRWSVGSVPPNTSVTSTVVIAAESDAQPGPRTVTASFIDGQGNTFASDSVTYEIVEPSEPQNPPELDLGLSFGNARESGSTGVFDPRQRLEVDLSLSNTGSGEATDPTIELTGTGPADWTVELYRADAGSWDGGSNVYTLSSLAAGAQDSPGFELAIPADVQEGYYTVSAAVRLDGEVVDRASKQIRVSENQSVNVRPGAAISASKTVAEAGEPIQFDASASRDPDGPGEITSYDWDFDGDGTFEDSGETTTHTFRSEGIYNVTLRVSDGNLANTDVLQVQVGTTDPQARRGDPSLTAPSADVEGPDASASVGESITLDGSGSRDPDGDVVEYQWDFDGDGTVDARGTTPAVDHAYTSAGTYYPEVTVVDTDGLTANASTMVDVVQSGEKPTVDFTVAGTQGSNGSLVIVGETVRFDPSASSGASGARITTYEWDFGDGSTVLSTPDLNQGSAVATHTYDRASEFDVSLTVTDENGVSATAEQTVEIIPPEGPAIVSIDPQKTGILPTGLGVDNEYVVGIQTDRDPDYVEFEFPNETVRADSFVSLFDNNRSSTRVEPLVDRVAGSVQGDEYKPVTVTAVDEAGASTTRRIQMRVADTPPHIQTLLGTAPVERRRGGEWVLESTGKYGLELPGVGFDLGQLGIKDASGQYKIRPVVDLDSVYRFQTGVIETSGTTTARIKVEPSPPKMSPFVSGPVGGGLSIDGQADLTSRPVTFDADVTYPISASEDLPTPIGKEFETKHFGKIELGLLGVIQVKSDNTVGIRIGGNGPPIEPTQLKLTPGFRVGIKGAAQANVSLGGTDVDVGVNVTGKTGPDVTARLLPNVRIGQVTADFTVDGEICLIQCVSETLYSETFPLAGSELPPPGGSSTAGIGATQGPVGSGLAVGEPTDKSLTAAAVDASRLSTTRLTDDGLTDRFPDLTRTSDGVRAVWSRQRAGSGGVDGIEIHTATRSGTWSGGEPVTNNSVLDYAPSVDHTGNQSVVAWARGRQGTAGDGAVGFDIAVTRSSGDDWTEPTRLTNGSALNLGPDVVGYNRSGGTTWLVAWMADTDANLSTTGDREVRYAILNGSLDIEVTGRVPDNTNVGLASSDSGFTFVSARGSGANASVVRARLTPRGSVLDRDVFRAASVTDVSTAADDTVWVSTNGTQSSVTYLSGTETERVPLGNATTVEDASLLRSGGKHLLIYRASAAGSDRSRTLYRVHTPSGWTEARGVPQDRPGIGTAVSANVTELLAVTGASVDNGTDLFAGSVSLRPDLTVSGTVATENVSVGDGATLNYTVENTGVRASGATVLEVTNRTGTVGTATIPSLGVTDEESGTLTVPVDTSGRAQLQVDSSDEVSELNESNNVATVQLADPSVAIRDVTERRNDSSVLLDVRVRNHGPVTAGQIPLRVTAGNASANATVRGVGAGRNWTRTVALNASDIDGPAAAVVTLDPDGKTGAIDRPNGTYRTTVLQPDLGVDDAVTVRRTQQGPEVEVYVHNSGTGNATARITAETPNGTTNATVPVPASRGAGDVRVRQTAVPTVAVSRNETVTVSVRPNGTVDGNLGDNVATETVGLVLPEQVAPVRDPDEDDLFEDVTGDGAVTLSDVLAYNEHRKSAVVRSNPDKFDFDGDGAAGTVFDALKLYQELQSG